MFVQSHELLRFADLKHAFFEASAPGWPSLCPSAIDGDTNESLEKRRNFLVHTLLGHEAPLLDLNQVHSSTVIRVDTLGKHDDRPTADGIVTKQKNIVLSIQSADCGPVLFYDTKNHIIGACHAGWRGAVGGILKNTIQAMCDLGAERQAIFAAIGPTISQEHYEVGPEFPSIILKDGLIYDDLFYPSKKSGHHYFNLPTYIEALLYKEKIGKIDCLNVDTFSGNFYSRRCKLAHNQQYVGTNNLSAIAII